MIDLAYVQEQVKMKKRKEILERYGECIWYSKKENCWYCHLPDNTKKSGRKKVKRKNQTDIENVVYDYFSKVDIKEDESLATFSNLFYEFMSHKKSQVKSGTISRMVVDWNKFYLPHKEFVEKPFKAINKIDVDDFLNGIAKEYRPKDKNFRNICGILKQTFEYAVDSDYLDKSPYRTNKVNKKNIIPTRKKPSEKEIFTQTEQKLLTEEMKRKISENKGYLVPWAILLDFEIGTRVGELLALRQEDIENDRVHIRRQIVQEYDINDLENIKSIGWHIVDYVKSDCGDRWIPLTEAAKQYISAIVELNKSLNRQVKDYLFITSNGVISDNAVKDQLERSCRKIGIPQRSTHKIRKTYASRLYKNGLSISDISLLLGHADETTTLKHYIFSLDDSSEVDDKVRNALKFTEYSHAPNQVTKSDQKIIHFSNRKSPQNIKKPPVSGGII